MKVVLTIAGSDSGGGAGIQGDLKTFEAHDVFGVCVLAALTAQNTRGVREVMPVPAAFVKAQLSAVFEDFEIAAVKVGMLFNAEIISVVAKALQDYKGPVIVDPVMVASSGDHLLEEAAMTALLKELLPLATMITPNIPEAEILNETSIKSREDALQAARDLNARYPKAHILLKGGHARSKETQRAVDILYFDGKCESFRAPMLLSRNTHGTGCTLSSAVAALMANGAEVVPAVQQAKDYVWNAIKLAPTEIGGGAGPLKHNWPCRS